MNVRLTILFLFFSVATFLKAQEIDSLSIGAPVQPLPSYLIPHPGNSYTSPSTSSFLDSGLANSPSILISPRALPASFILDHSGLFGPLGGYGEQTVYPGLMDVRSAHLNLSASLGPLDLSLWGDAAQIGSFNSYHRRFGYGINARYNFSDRLSLTLFGSYYTPLGSVSPAMAGFFTTTRAGGYLSYDFSDNWGISVGAQTVRSDLDGRWRSQPIVVPYYKVNKNVNIGADIGAILYNLLYDPKPHNPTIGPPRH